MGECLGRPSTEPWQSVGSLGGSWDRKSCPTCPVTAGKLLSHHASGFSHLQTKGTNGLSLRFTHAHMICVPLWLAPKPPSSHPTQVPRSPQPHLLLEECNPPAASLPLFGADICIATGKSR